MNKRTLSEEVNRQLKLMGLITESSGEGPITYLRKLILPAIEGGENSIEKFFGKEVAKDLESKGVKNLNDLDFKLSNGVKDLPIGSESKILNNEINDLLTKLVNQSSKKIFTDLNLGFYAKNIVVDFFKLKNNPQLKSFGDAIMKLDLTNPSIINRPDVQDYLKKARRAFDEVFGPDEDFTKWFNNYYTKELENGKIVGPDQTGLKLEKPSATPKPNVNSRVTDALKSYKYDYIKNNNLDNFNSLVKKYKNREFTTDQFLKFLETGAKINLSKPVKKVYSIKGVKFTETEYDDIVKLIEDIDNKLKSGELDTRYRTTFGTIRIETTRGKTSDVIGYTNEWVDDIAKQNNWNPRDVDIWKNAGGIAPYKTSDVYINMSHPYYTKTFLRDLVFHEFGHMKDPALIKSPRYSLNYDPKGAPMNKKYFYHQSEKTANISSYQNSLTYQVNKWIELGLTKDVIISKLEKFKKMLQSGNLRIDDIQYIFGKDWGIAGHDLMRMFNAQRGLYTKQKKDILSKYYVQIDDIIKQLSIGTRTNKSTTQKLGTELIPVISLRRPNGQIGTQGFTSENMINLIEYISTKKGFEMPTYKTLKELIENLKKDSDIVKSITSYVESDPITAIKLPDGTINIKDGNHRANLLNLLGVENIPVIFK